MIANNFKYVHIPSQYQKEHKNYIIIFKQNQGW